MPIGGGIPAYIPTTMPQDQGGWYNLYPGKTPATTAAPAVPSATGAKPATYNPAVGGIPQVPDPLAEIQKAIGAYTANLPTLQGVANTTNAANQAALVKQITDLYPQFGANVNQMGMNIGNWAAGNISDSTRRMLSQSMAERGAAGGFGPDAGATNAALMAVLGKTSEGLQSQAINAQNALLSGIPRTSLTDATKLMPSPGDLLKGITEADLLANIYAAAPNPADAYNLAKADALSGLRLGQSRATGPFAGTPGGDSSATQQLLDMLVKRGTGSAGALPKYGIGESPEDVARHQAAQATQGTQLTPAQWDQEFMNFWDQSFGEPAATASSTFNGMPFDPYNYSATGLSAGEMIPMTGGYQYDPYGFSDVSEPDYMNF